MPRILPPNRPKLPREAVRHIVNYHRLVFPHKFTDGRDQVNVVFIRGYYGKSLGKTDGNDYNIYDDAAFIIAPDFFKPFNANADPSFVVHPKTGKKLAKLNLGVYPFYKGKHKNSYWAFRAFPEGVILPCTRDGVPATCQYVNCHYGGENPQSWYVTWSEACLTIPQSQFIGKTGFQQIGYDLMDKYGQRTVNFILVERVKGTEKYRAGNGQIIPDVLEVEQINAESAVEETPETSQIPSVESVQPPTLSNFNPKDLLEPLVLEIAPMDRLPNVGETITDCFKPVEIEEKTFEPIVGTIERIQETAKRGMNAYETAIKVTSGKTTSFWLQLFGICISLSAGVIGFLRDNWKLIVVGVFGVVVLTVSIAVIFMIINHLKMKYAADPTKNNVE